MNPHNELLIVLVLFATNIPCFGLDPLLSGWQNPLCWMISAVSTDEFSFLASKKHMDLSGPWGNPPKSFIFFEDFP